MLPDSNPSLKTGVCVADVGVGVLVGGAVVGVGVLVGVNVFVGGATVGGDVLVGVLVGVGVFVGVGLEPEVIVLESKTVPVCEIASIWSELG